MIMVPATVDPKMRYFEDFTPGLSGTHGPVWVSAEDIVAFAAEFDPQPMHLDAGAARDSLFEGLVASGWHSCCLMMRMICEDFLLSSASLGSPGIEALKWLRPVRPGDSLLLSWRVIEARASRSRSDMGLVKFEFDLIEGAGERLLAMSNVIMFGRRPATQASA